MMEYQKIINVLYDTTNQPSKFRTRNRVEINDEPRGVYNYGDNDDNNDDNSNNIKFKASMIRSSLCDYSDAYIVVNGTITVPNTAVQVPAVNNTNKKVILKNCCPFTTCITEINNTQVDYAEDIDIDVVMLMYNSIEYSNAYSKTSGSLWQYCRDEPTRNNNGNIINFPADNNNSNSFKFKQQITGQTKNGGTNNVEIMVSLKYPRNFWRTLEMPLINCEITLQLTCSKKRFLVAGTASNQVPKFKITGAKLYVPVVTLSIQENIELLKQLESGF